MSTPVVSVVTPFYNTAAYLKEAVESVLAQTLTDFELILADNCSQDGSAQIAQELASRDARIRYFRFEELLPQVPNYNRALALMAPGAQFCKVVQADDWLFPRCLEEMVRVAAAHPTAGVVSSYYLQGTEVLGNGLPPRQEFFPGKEIGARQLSGDGFYTGSPTTVMYRADLVRARTPFYRDGRLHEDTEVIYDILVEHDFAFVHQVLSYLRVEDSSIMGRRESYNPGDLDELICLREYGSRFLDEAALHARERDLRRWYHRFLARSLLNGRGRDFWKYHRKGLATIGETLPRRSIALRAMTHIVDRVLNPKRTLQNLLQNRRF